MISLVIAYTCAKTPTGYSDACSHALEAGSKQSQIYQYEDGQENRLKSNARNEAIYYLGKEPIELAGAGLYVYKVYRDKSIIFKLPNMGLCNDLSNKITPNSYTLNIGWVF